MKLFKLIISILLIIGNTNYTVFAVKRSLSDGYQTEPDSALLEKRLKQVESKKRQFRYKPEPLPTKVPRQINNDSLLYKFTSDMCKYYKEFSKRADTPQKFENILISINDFNDTLDNFIDLYTDQKSNFLKSEKWVENKAPNKNLLKDFESDLNFRHPYAQKIDLPSDSHIITFGDIHGSLHSFIRNLWSLYNSGFIDEDLKILAPKGNIVFLGDIVDRGRYSVELLFLIMKIKIKNPDNVFILRGNHEDPKMGGNYTIRTEINDKYSNDKYPKEVDNVIKKLNCIYDLFPFVLFVGSDKKYTIFSHAGVDPSYNPVNLLSSDKAYECLKDKKDNSIFLDEQTRTKALEHFKRRESMPVGEQTGFYCVGFNWCDFARYKNSKKEILHNSNEITFSGHGYNISTEVFEKYLNDLNRKLSPQIKVLGLVRGHQHMSHGLCMIDEKIKVSDGQMRNYIDVVETSDIFTPNGFSMSKYFPVYTLMSAPEGVGQDDSHGIEVKFDQDAFCMITTGDWHIKPFSCEITKRSPDGVYCSIKSAGFKALENPFQFSYTHNPIDSEVDYLFEKLKSKTYLKINSPKQKLPTSFKYPISSDIKTQSLNHMRFVCKKENLDKSDLMAFGVDTEDYLSLVEKAIHQEILHSNDYFVFYHAHSPNLAPLHDILKLFYCWGFLNHAQPLPLRFIRSGIYAPNLSAFLDQTSSIVKNSDGLYMYVDENRIPQNRCWFDHIPEIGIQLLSTNFSIFGNKSTPAESSFSYFKERRSVHNFEISKILSNIFAQNQIPKIFLDKILQLTQKYTKSFTQSGKLLQIFIKKDSVDECAYWAFAGGKPINQKVIGTDWDESKKYHTKISTLLHMYQEQPQDLNDLLSQIHYSGVSHKYNLDLDRIQARIWLPCNFLYDPEKTKIFRYETGKSDEYKHFLTELNKIFEEIIKHFIKQKLLDQTAPFQHISTPLSELDRIVSDYKIQKSTQDTRAYIGAMDLETPREMHPNEEFFTLAAKIQTENVINRNVKKRLKEILPIIQFLSDGSTPLIYAVKINSTPLVKFLTKLPNLDFFAKDKCGNTALDWCKNLEHNKLETIISYSIKIKDNSKFEEVYKLVKDILDKKHDEDLIQLAMDFVYKAILRNPNRAAELAMRIIDIKPDPDTLKWAMDFAYKAGPRNPNKVTELAMRIIDKKSDPDTLKWALDFAYKAAPLTPNGATELVQKIIDKKPDTNVLKLARDFLSKTKQPQKVACVIQ